MRNHFQPGNSLDFIAPSGGVTSGSTYKKGAIMHVASTSALEGETYNGDIHGVFTLASQTGTAWTQGDVLYWDDSAKVWTKTSTSNTKGGMAAYDKASADATGKVLLLPQV